MRIPRSADIHVAGRWDRGDQLRTSESRNRRVSLDPNLFLCSSCALGHARYARGLRLEDDDCRGKS